jgi:hypothetical protein
VQTVKTVEVNGALVAVAGLTDGDVRTVAVIIRIFEGNDNVQAIHSAALENQDKNLFGARGRLGAGCAHEKTGRQAHGDKAETGRFQKSPAGRVHDYLR